MTERPRVEIIEQAIRSHSANDWLNLTGPIDLARAIDCGLGLDAAESEGQAAKTPLPEPDATNPEHLRWCADIIDLVAPNDALDPIALRALADRLDAARSAEREREQRIEAAAKVLADFTFVADRDDAARALDAAGLLRGGGRGE